MTEFVPLPGTWPTATYALNVNDTTLPVDTGWLGESLLFTLRERGGLTAAKDGCGPEVRGECGACTVFLDGEPTISCLVPAVAAIGRKVTTPEAFATVPPDSVALALADQAGPGCGFCLPGIAMSLRALLVRSPQPSAASVREALSGHQCRCLGVDRFLAAVRSLTQTPAAAPQPAPALLDDSQLIEMRPASPQPGPGQSGSAQSGSGQSGPAQSDPAWSDPQHDQSQPWRPEPELPEPPRTQVPRPRAPQPQPQSAQFQGAQLQGAQSQGGRAQGAQPQRPQGQGGQPQRARPQPTRAQHPGPERQVPQQPGPQHPVSQQPELPFDLPQFELPIYPGSQSATSQLGPSRTPDQGSTR